MGVTTIAKADATVATAATATAAVASDRGCNFPADTRPIASGDVELAGENAAATTAVDMKERAACPDTADFYTAGWNGAYVWGELYFIC